MVLWFYGSMVLCARFRYERVYDWFYSVEELFFMEIDLQSDS